MKKIIVFLFILLIPLKVSAISAETAIVMDQDSGRVLWSKNENREKLIASTTKIMTAIVAIENGNLSENVKVNKEVLKAYGSNIYIEVGEEINLIDLLYGLMLRSGNDAAIMIAESVSGDMGNFVKQMNKTAKDIGMDNTKFYNSHGLEEKNNVGNTSTAYDMALLTRYAMKNETFRKIFSTKNYTAVSSKKTYTWTNKNRLLSSYEYTTGGKTGFTDLARRTLVTTASKNGMNLIVVTLNDGNDFADHKALYEQYFNSYEVVEVLNPSNFTVDKDNYYKNNELVIKNKFTITVTGDEKNDIRTEIELEKKTFVRDNERVGTAKVYFKDELIHEEGIYIDKNSENEDNRSWWQKFLDFLKFWD